MPVGIITNLNSRKNRRGMWRADRLRRFVGADGIVHETRDLSEVRAVIEDFVDRGCRYWVADGGDGTLHWMMNVGREVLVERGLWNRSLPYPFLVPTNGGTIDFVARKAGMSGGPDAIIRDLVTAARQGRDPRFVELDTIEVTGYRPGDPDGIPGFRRIGFAVAIGGIGQRFFRKYYESRNPNAWTIIEVCVKASIGQLGKLPLLARLPVVPPNVKDFASDVLAGTLAEVDVDGRRFQARRLQGLHASSVDIDFGTMRLFPYAATPGKLHAVVGALSLVECTWKWMYLVAGKPLAARDWHEMEATRMEARAAGDEPLDPIVDGEMFYGLDRITVELGPKVRIPVIAAKGPGI
jgi:hypothetical protein